MFDFWANYLSSSLMHFQDFFKNAFQLVWICLPAVSARLFLTQHFAGNIFRKDTGGKGSGHMATRRPPCSGEPEASASGPWGGGGWGGKANGI